jgi:hypothetical protein
MFATVLTAIAVSNINPRPFHRRFLPFALDVNVSPQAHNRGHRNRRRRRMQHIIAIRFFDRQFSRKPHTYRPRHTNRAERFVRKI